MANGRFLGMDHVEGMASLNQERRRSKENGDPASYRLDRYGDVHPFPQHTTRIGLHNRAGYNNDRDGGSITTTISNPNLNGGTAL
jgi:hypothetical protein